MSWQQLAIERLFACIVVWMIIFGCGMAILPQAGLVWFLGGMLVYWKLGMMEPP